jgi:hypothetical protein
MIIKEGKKDLYTLEINCPQSPQQMGISLFVKHDEQVQCVPQDLQLK